MKTFVLLFTFLLGALAGAAALGGYWVWRHSTTEVWVAERPLQSDSGLVVPAGTELVLERWMPEGFAALTLAVNVEGEALEHFQRRTEQKRFLRIPYSVDARQP